MTNPWKLTGRQAEILVLLGNGEPQKAVAQRLGVGVATIKTHMTIARKRMGIRTTLGCVVAWDRWVRART